MTNAPFKQVDLIQGSEEWHKWRRLKIGASEVAAIMGDCPFNTPLDIYEKKMSGERSEENEGMRRGKEFEKRALDWLNNQNNENYEPACFESIPNPHLVASLDAWNQFASIKAAEIKYLKKEWFKQALEGVVPLNYLWQMQTQMCVMNLSHMFFVFGNGDEIGCLPVEADQKMIDTLSIKTKEFYDKFLEFTPPEPCDRDYQTYDEKIPAHLIEELKISQDFNKWSEIQIKQTRYEIMKPLIRDNVKRAIAHGSKITCLETKGRIDYKKMCEDLIDEQIIREKIKSYRSKPVISWRIIHE